MIQKLNLANELADGRVDDSPECKAPGRQFEARWIDSVDGLVELESSWKRLAADAIRKNLLFESNFLIPAFQHLNDQNARILVIESPSATDPQGPRDLYGLVPLVNKRIYGLPLSGYEVWRTVQCFDATPLIRKDGASEALGFIFDFLEREGTGLLSLDLVAADGRFERALSDAIKRRGMEFFQRNKFSRATFEPAASFDEYFAKIVSKSVRKNVTRLERRLGEKGDLTWEVSNSESDFSKLAQQFLDLEASGWKGREGTALACDPSTTAFFKHMVSRSSNDERVSFLSLKLDGNPIAMLCDLYSDGVGCSYKTAYNESFSQFSPGLLAEIKNIEFMHRSNVAIMDSCTAPDNATINRIWRGSIGFQSLVIALPGRLPALATRIMPLIQSAARAVKRLIKKLKRS